MAAFYIRQGSFPAAGELVGRALEKHAADVALLRLQAILDSHANNTSEAIKRLKKAYVLAPNDPEVLDMLGQLASAAKQWPLAIEVLEKLVGQKPDGTAARVRLAAALYGAGKYDRALTLAGKLLEKHPDQIEVRILAGRCHFKQKRYAEAVQSWEEVLRRSPTAKGFGSGLAASHIELGNRLKAIKVLRRIMDDRILSENPRTLQELGREFDVSRERVRQLEARLVAQLREYMKENLVDFEYYAPPKG